VDAINARLAAVGYEGAQISTGVYPNPVHNTNFLAKLDHQFSRSDQFSVRYSLYDIHSNNSRGAGALNAVSASAGLDNTDQTIAVSNVVTLSPRTVNETRGQFTYSNLQALPTDPIGPAVSIAGIASFGTLSGSPTGRLNRLYEIVDNLSHQRGARAESRLRVPIQRFQNHVPSIFPGQLLFLIACQLPEGNLYQLGLYADVWQLGCFPDEPEPRLLRAGRVEGKPSSHFQYRHALRPAISRNHLDRFQQHLPAGRVRLVAVSIKAHRSSR